MDVINHAHRCIWSNDISIETTTRLPIQPFGFLTAFARNSIRRFRQQILDRLSDGGDVRFCIPRANDQIDVLWHEHVCPQIEVSINRSFLDRLRQPLAGSFRLQKFEAFVAGKSQLVSVPRLVIVSAMLSLLSHDSELNWSANCWGLAALDPSHSTTAADQSPSNLRAGQSTIKRCVGTS